MQERGRENVFVDFISQNLEKRGRQIHSELDLQDYVSIPAQANQFFVRLLVLNWLLAVRFVTYTTSGTANACSDFVKTSNK